MIAGRALRIVNVLPGLDEQPAERMLLFVLLVVAGRAGQFHQFADFLHR